MINWNYIREHYPLALKKYMSKGWTLEDFWNAYEVYANLRIIEKKTGEELWDFKVQAKLVMYSTLCYKTIIRDGKKISVITFDELQERKINEIFKLIEEQIENDNYLNN